MIFDNWIYFFLGIKSKYFQVFLDIFVGSIVKVIKYAVCRSFLSVEIESISLAFSEFFTSFSEKQRHSDTIDFSSSYFSDKFTPISNISPLITSSELKNTVLCLIKLKEIVGLDDRIWKFRIRDSFRWIEPSCYCLFVQEGAHSKYFAYIPQEFDSIHFFVKFIIVDKLEVIQFTYFELLVIDLILKLMTLHLDLNISINRWNFTPQSIYIVQYYLFFQQSPLVEFTARISD